MKKVLYTLLFYSCLITGQIKDTLKLKDLEIPNSPALTLLDKSFSVIETVSSSNEMSANLVNVKDNSVEITPYWFLKKGKMLTMKEYYGINKDLTQNCFVNIKKTSISIAYVPTDTLTSISFGIRTNLISIKNGSAKKRYYDYNTERNTYQNEIPSGQTQTRFQLKMIQNGDGDISKAKLELINEFDNSNDKSGQTNKTRFDKIVGDLKKYMNNSLFSFDIAAAVSSYFPGNQSNSGRVGRYGVWASSQLNLPLDDAFKNFIKVYALGRVLNDKTLFNSTTNVYEENNYFDVGGKLEFQFKSISIAGEYVNRTGDVKDNRLVGLIEYKINDSLYISGGYGKNFDNPVTGNLITLFGLKWGLYKERQANIDTN